MRIIGVVGMLVVVPLSVAAQQVSDDSFRFDNPNPAFSAAEAPRVCIDEARRHPRPGRGLGHRHDRRLR